MPERLLALTAESDTRFQYEIIKGLSESIRQQSASTERLAAAMADMQKTQIGMLERLAKLEANRVGETVAKIEAAVEVVKERVDATVEAVKDRVDKLEQDKDRRDGAGSFVGLLFKYGPTVFSLMTLLYLAGRSIGLVPAPPAPPTRIETSETPYARDTEQGGKP